MAGGRERYRPPVIEGDIRDVGVASRRQWRLGHGFGRMHEMHAFQAVLSLHGEGFRLQDVFDPRFLPQWGPDKSVILVGSEGIISIDNKGTIYELEGRTLEPRLHTVTSESMSTLPITSGRDIILKTNITLILPSTMHDQVLAQTPLVKSSSFRVGYVTAAYVRSAPQQRQGQQQPL